MYGAKKSGGTASFTSLYFASCTRPTISVSSVSPPLLISVPTALRPRLNFRVNASLTIETLAPPLTSARVNSRPAISGTPIVLK